MDGGAFTSGINGVIGGFAEFDSGISDVMEMFQQGINVAESKVLIEVI